ncbi:MAG: ADP-ribosylglycohydrolase family protein [Planctomycetota bacterium]|jgi:ADP-ribosylglycohydrolase
MSIPADYEERVYAGVLGKIIGVYMGRPIEGCTYEWIMERLGETHYYVHERVGQPLIVPDDDISGTLTFLRALPDHGTTLELTPEQIGQTWLNYLIEERTVLWWGGLGKSTGHTAYLRLKSGVQPPASGSIETNGRTVAEQIGAQIFIDGWGLVSPGDPEQAAELARRAACVSHGGEAIYGAQVVAALVAGAFTESDMGRLLDAGVAAVPADSTIARLHADIREWREQDDDWHKTRARIAERYGYDKYGGGCHVIPNHAIIVLALAYADDRFQRALMIGNTAGWDTDCNVGNIGCIMGVKVGLAGLDVGPDWRGPVADRLYIPTADGGRVVTDAVREADSVAQIGRALAGEAAPAPKDGARFHFERPGSVQGFLEEDSVECAGVTTVKNVQGHSESGSRSLAIRYDGVSTGRSARVATAMFLPPAALGWRGTYWLMASPALYPGQTVRARVELDAEASGPVQCRLHVRVYGANDKLENLRGPGESLAPGQSTTLEWKLPPTDGAPIAAVGVEVCSNRRADGTLYLDWLDWQGTPNVVLGPSPNTGQWRSAWVDAVSQFDVREDPQPYDVVQNQGRGLLIQGCREWSGYSVSADVTPYMAESAGRAMHVQCLRRYYALLCRRGGKVDLVRFLEGETVLASAQMDWPFGESHQMTLSVQDGEIFGSVDDAVCLSARDEGGALASGAVALICEEGRAHFGPVAVSPNS